MRLPRDISGRDLARALRAFGYEVKRQTGSHIRLTSTLKGQHHVTIPNHSPIRLGTLSELVSDIADHFGISRDEVAKQLFDA
ncbi:MAG TPA: type II toxin-antitoxin system HicA family toxin [Alphaproteobacteria bacterium]